MLRKNQNVLEDNEFKKFTSFSSLMREKNIVHFILNLDVELHDTYWLYQDLLDAFQRKDVDRFFETLEEPPKHCSVSTFISVTSLLQHKESATNALNYSFSNGRIEGTYNLIKVIKRIAFGYRNFTTFRTRILLVTNTR